MDIQNFSPRIDCDNPEFWTNRFSGKVGLGTTCVIKCRTGYKFKNHLVDEFPIKCSQNLVRGVVASIVDWDIFYQDANRFVCTDNNCREYPECIPVEESTTMEPLTTTFEPLTTTLV